MHRRRIVQILAAALMLAAAGVGLWRKGGAQPEEPEEAVYRMLNAARAGDVEAYLESYTGPMEVALRRTVVESTTPAFAKYLLNTNAAIKGVAVSDIRKLTDREAKLLVEYVYQDRNERQIVSLEKANARWKISAVEVSERSPVLVPYGTPVRLAH